jgi:hypothetical protein
MNDLKEYLCETCMNLYYDTAWDHLNEILEQGGL